MITHDWTRDCAIDMTKHELVTTPICAAMADDHRAMAGSAADIANALMAVFGYTRATGKGR